MSHLTAIMALKVKGRHYPDNIGRGDILFSSLRHFGLNALFDEFLIVVPGDEEQHIRRYAKAWADFPIRWVVEDEYLTLFKKFSSFHQVRPWHRQQIIKLFCAQLVKNDFFLVLDPDVFAVKPFGYGDVVVGDRALCEPEPRSEHAQWWKDSAEVLGVEPHLERPGFSVTPALLSRDGCRSLTRAIEEKHGRTWYEVLLSRYMTQWTEYTLYALHLENTVGLARYHLQPEEAPPGVRLHSKTAVWVKGQFEQTDFSRAFAASEPGLFSLVQSNVGVSPQEVAKALAPWLPVTVQHYEKVESRREKLRELAGAATRKAMQLARERAPAPVRAFARAVLGRLR